MAILEVKVGNTIKWDCTYKDSEGAVIPLTGYNLRCQARLDDTNDLQFDLSIGNGITITDESNGEFQIKILDTTSYTKDRFKVDIEYSHSSEIISTDTFYLDMIEAVTI